MNDLGRILQSNLSSFILPPDWIHLARSFFVALCHNNISVTSTALNLQLAVINFFSITNPTKLSAMTKNKFLVFQKSKIFLRSNFEKYFAKTDWSIMYQKKMQMILVFQKSKIFLRSNFEKYFANTDWSIIYQKKIPENEIN